MILPRVKHATIGSDSAMDPTPRMAMRRSVTESPTESHINPRISLRIGDIMATYYIYDPEKTRKGEEPYSTTSIIKARAYCVKILRKYPKATFWHIYTSKDRKANPHSGVVFYGTPAGYGWVGEKGMKYIYENGQIRTQQW